MARVSRHLPDGLRDEGQVHPQDLQSQVKIDVRQRVVGTVDVVIGPIGTFDGQDGRNVRVQERDLQTRLKVAGAQWDKTAQVWRVRRATAVPLGLKKRIVP